MKVKAVTVHMPLFREVFSRRMRGNPVKNLMIINIVFTLRAVAKWEKGSLQQLFFHLERKNR